jgi:hypothetical protein
LDVGTLSGDRLKPERRQLPQPSERFGRKQAAMLLRVT